MPDPDSTHLDVETLGLGVRRIRYESAWEYQREIHSQVADGQLSGRVLLLEHEAVYTAGRQTKPEERPFDGTPVVDVDRGGKITWHGPGQLVGYPIVRLPSRVGVVDHVRRMEQAVIGLLSELGIEAGRVEGRTGVWLPAISAKPVTASASEIWDSDPASLALGTALPPVTVPNSLANVIATPARRERKICAIGIRVARRTTMHGFAINVSNSNAAFENIVPCGIRDAEVTSIARELDESLPLAELAAMLTPHLRRCLDYSRPTSEIVTIGRVTT